MNTLSICPRCERPLLPDAPAGHCPNCLVELALEAGGAETVRPATSNGAAPPPVQPGVGSGARLKYFGDYELIEEIARGGMGVVWRARQATLNRPVALKLILAGRFATEADVRRFHTEAEAAANLQHPNIVAIHEIGECEGQHYFSMDYVEGRNLAEVVREVPLPVAQAAALIKRIAEAVHYAHQRGTLHRDLKPSNVLIDAEGQPHITDFGLAKQLSRDSGLTQTGAVMGTPAYMPPEQAAGRNEQVGPASDVYAIGAMCYHLLTGHAPFVGETPTATLRQALEEEPVRPSKLNPTIAPDLETICLKCLEKQPERRYHSARELAEELGRFLAHEPILARPASVWRKAWTWSQRHPWAIVGLAAAIGLALLGLAYGLWEQVQYLRVNSLPPGPERTRGDRGGFAFEIYAVLGYLIVAPTVFFARFLRDRQRRNRAVSSLQLAVLSASGLSLIALGLWSASLLIRLHVWKHSYHWYTLVGFGLGNPFIFCWLGGLWLWQAVHTHQTHWSGAVTSEREWLPRQPLRYHTGSFIAATLVNLLGFAALAYFTTPLWYDHDVFRFNDPPPFGFLWPCFVFVALVTSFTCWAYATRKVNRVPKPALCFFCVLVGGSALVWFTVPGTQYVPVAVLTGLLGGLLLVKVVRVRQLDSLENPPPLRLDELFEWDGRALALALGGVVAGLLTVAGLLSRRHADDFLWFLFFSGVNALWPAVVLAVRATTGKRREFFYALLVPLVLWGLVWPIGTLADWPKDAPLLASIPAGLAAGWFLIRWGNVRSKAH